MKFATVLLPALIAGALTSEARSASTQIEFNGRNYTAVRMGRSTKVTPNLALVHVTPAGPDEAGPANPANPGCDAIYSELKRREYLFDDCRGNADRPVCKLLVSGLRMLAEGRPDTDTPIDRTVTKAWALAAPAVEEADTVGLRAAVAEQLQVRASSVDVVSTGSQPRFTGVPFYVFTPGSASEKVSRLVSFRLEDIGTVQGDRLVTRNNIFACDLARGQAMIQAHSASVLRSVDRVPDAVVDLAWDAYRALDAASAEIDAEASPLVRAAVIGYHLASVLGGRTVDDPLATPAALFRRLYDANGALPVLKPAASREGLRAAAYPDVSFQETIQQDWRLQ